jgi:acyl dehydratase
MTKVYCNTLKVGHAFLSVTMPPISRVQVAQMASALDDFSPLHLDDAVAKSEGFGGAFAHPIFAYALANEIMARSAENARILTVTGTFQKLVWPGDILTGKGTVSKHEKRPDDTLVEVELVVENQAHDVIMKGKAFIVVWNSTEDEKKNRSPLPPLTAKQKIDFQKKCESLARAEGATLGLKK